MALIRPVAAVTPTGGAKLGRGAVRAPLAPMWPDTLVCRKVWHGVIYTVRTVRALTSAEAAMDLRALAREGALPSRERLAERWGWPGEAGLSKARRLRDTQGRWMDSALATWQRDNAG